MIIRYARVGVFDEGRHKICKKSSVSKSKIEVGQLSKA